MESTKCQEQRDTAKETPSVYVAVAAAAVLFLLLVLPLDAALVSSCARSVVVVLLLGLLRLWEDMFLLTVDCRVVPAQVLCLCGD